MTPGWGHGRPRTRRRAAADETAVSTVLGAVLVFGLLVLTLVTIQVKFVPVWDRDREADLMEQVSQQMATIKADADRQADNRTNVPVTDPILLGAGGGFRFFQGPSLPGALRFEPPGAGGGFTVAADQGATVLARNGRAIFGGSETWTDIVGDTVSDIATVAHLRLRVETPHAWDTGDSLTLTVTDANGAYAGKFVLMAIDHGATYSFQFDTYAQVSDSSPISTRQESYQKQVPPTYQYFDLLRDEFLFNDVLAAADAPFEVALTRNVMQGDYTMSYDVQDPSGGTTTVGNAGILVPDYEETLAGGSLTYDGANTRYPDQDYILEHGAIILVQPDGAVMRVPPQIAANLGAGVVDIRWTVPALSGDNSGVSGPTQATVTIEATGARVDVVATAPMLAFTVTTQYPAVWTQYWSTLMQGAGLSLASGQFAVSSTPTTATLTVYGLQTAPLSTVDDIHLELKGAHLETHVQAVAGA